jgi:hypothetical protein
MYKYHFIAPIFVNSVVSIPLTLNWPAMLRIVDEHGNYANEIIK